VADLLVVGEGAQVHHQLPDLFVCQVIKQGHRRSQRAILDNPVQLSVANTINRSGAGKIARWRIELVSLLTAAIALIAVAGYTTRVRQILV